MIVSYERRFYWGKYYYHWVIYLYGKVWEKSDMGYKTRQGASNAVRVYLDGIGIIDYEETIETQAGEAYQERLPI